MLRTFHLTRLCSPLSISILSHYTTATYIVKSIAIIEYIQQVMGKTPGFTEPFPTRLNSFCNFLICILKKEKEKARFIGRLVTCLHLCLGKLTVYILGQR